MENKALEKLAADPNLHLQTYTRIVKLTPGQKSLLNTIKDCVANKKILDWDLIVTSYLEGRNKPYYVARWRGMNKGYEYEETDIMQEYKKLSVTWTYTIKPMIRSWFLSTIGALVVKNQLIIIPVIDAN